MEFLRIASELLKNAKILFENEEYTSSAILASKAVFALIDYIIFSKFGILVNNHKKRFEIVRNKLPDIYPYLDEVFRIYTSAYRLVIGKEDCRRVIEIAERVKEEIEGNIA